MSDKKKEMALNAYIDLETTGLPDIRKKYDYTIDDPKTDTVWKTDPDGSSFYPYPDTDRYDKCRVVSIAVVFTDQKMKMVERPILIYSQIQMYI